MTLDHKVQVLGTLYHCIHRQHLYTLRQSALVNIHNQHQRSLSKLLAVSEQQKDVVNSLPSTFPELKWCASRVVLMRLVIDCDIVVTSFGLDFYIRVNLAIKLYIKWCLYYVSLCSKTLSLPNKAIPKLHTI